jgi:hypothetical protein
VLALKRWCSGLTLCSPAAVPNLSGLWAWLLGLLALLLVAMVFQGPGRALGQLFDAAGHVRLLGAALDRLRSAGRMVAVTVGVTVVAWTVSQTLRFNDPQGRDDVLLLTKARSLGELALEQGVLAALTPVRDLYGLGDNLMLLSLASVVLFRVLTERSDHPRVVAPGARLLEAGPRTTARSPSRWANLLWGATSLYLLYRLGRRVAGPADLPVGYCLPTEAVAVPLLMVVADGVILAWILEELRSASLGDGGNERLDPQGVVGLVPGAILACLLAMPARYVATATWLAYSFLPPEVGATALGAVFRWLLSWGLADLQGAALLSLGLAGAVPWSRGTVSSTVRGYRRLLAAEGGHLVALLLLGGLAAGAAAALAYVLVLSLPASTWVLAAADGYAHYATLPVGLLLLAAMVELGERALPTAALAGAGKRTRLVMKDQPAA